MAHAEVLRYLNMAQRAEALPSSPFPRPVEPPAPDRKPLKFPVPPQPEIPPQPPQEIPPQPPQKINRRSFLKWGGAVVAGATVGALVTPVVENWLKNLGLKERPVPAVFDNNAVEGIIGAKDTVALSLAEIERQFPQQVVQNGDNLSFLFPFQLPEGGRTEYVKSLSGRLSSSEIQAEAQQKDIKEHIDFVLPKGTNIILSTTSRVLVEYGRSDWGQNPDSIVGFRFFFKQNDTTYYVWVFGPNKEDAFQSISSIPKSPLASINWSGTDWKNLPSFDQGTPIMRTLKDNQDIRFTVRAYKGENIGLEAEVKDKTLLLFTPQFFTQESGKLVALAK